LSNAKKSRQKNLSPPKLDAERAITELGVGEALVSLLDEEGRPKIVERAYIVPPASKLGPITADERKRLIESSAVFGHYESAVDRESAYEKVKERTEAKQPEEITGGERSRGATTGSGSRWADILFGSTGPRGGRCEGVLESAAKSAARTIGSHVGREIIRGVLGSILGGGRRR
jgi:uncharacterized protein